ncbi:hypothetical protein [Longimicrobium sp.]|uniref:hypothetical protein n=1 Tax=Longimicrobium sp. TaxID=2029185 RepID=UPI002ED9D518
MFRPRIFVALAAAALSVAAACDSAPMASAAASAPSLLVAPTSQVNLTVLGTAYCGPGACVHNYRFDAWESTDSDGTIVAYEWKEGGTVVSTSSTYYVTALRAYETCSREVQGTLKVTDNDGNTHTDCYSYTPA